MSVRETYKILTLNLTFFGVKEAGVLLLDHGNQMATRMFLRTGYVFKDKRKSTV